MRIKRKSGESRKKERKKEIKKMFFISQKMELKTDSALILQSFNADIANRNQHFTVIKPRVLYATIQN